jgi:signal transduction histidine kinase
VVQKEVQRINTVVETLFTFARPPRPEVRSCSINDAVRDVLRAFEEELKARSIALETKWDATAPAAAIDPVYFSQALHNVVQNAIEAMPEGGRIRVETRRENGSAEILVTDTGPGVRPEDAPRIFLPFYSTKERGMGLGLSIAHRILQHHEGVLKLYPNSDGGGFLIHLPARPEVHRDPRIGAQTEQ